MDTATVFDYQTYDRQMASFINMSYVLIEEWDDYTMQEMSYDLRSLCIKGSRLCGMTDYDLALQQEDLTDSRQVMNQDYYIEFNSLIKSLTDLLHRTVNRVRAYKEIKKPDASVYQQNLTTLMPKLGKWITLDEQQEVSLMSFVSEIPQIVDEIEKQVSELCFPGEPWESCFMNLFRFYVLVCYLFFHFQRLVQINDAVMSREEAGSLLTNQVQMQAESEEGQEALRKYTAQLKYENDFEMPGEKELKMARRKLAKEVLPVLQTCFMEHVEDMNDLAMDIIKIKPAPTNEEYKSFLNTIIKYQWLSERIYEYAHPEEMKSSLYNKVFYTSVNGKPVDFKRLRKKIEKMIKHLHRKNGWFCIYSVLKFHNYIKDPVATHFAEQMQDDDWFPELKDYLRFSGETLTEYNGYLNDVPFTVWNQQDYDSYRLRHNKTKWAPGLWEKFKDLCYQLNDEFMR